MIRRSFLLAATASLAASLFRRPAPEQPYPPVDEKHLDEDGKQYFSVVRGPDGNHVWKRCHF